MSAEIALPAGPRKAPASGWTQKAPFGKAAQPSRAPSPWLRFPRTMMAAPSSSQPTAARTKGSMIWLSAVSRHAEKSPRRPAVATSWARR